MLPGISFHLPDRERPIDPQEPRWRKPLPSTPSATGSPATMNAFRLSYGEYFQTIARFLACNAYRQVRRAVETLRPSAAIPDRWRLKIVSEKHGAFYHPARIQVDLGRCTLDLVVNLALSDEGRRALPREVQNLLRLELEYGLPHLPRVFGSKELALDDGPTVSLFLGEWFNGYFEFHLAPHPVSGRRGIHLWQPGQGDRFLTSPEIQQLFRQAALILTAYYNPLTTEHIFPWHHGAGDFVWSPEASSGDLAVRLVTVRGYGPLIHGFPDSPAAGDIVDGLVLFFLLICLRMRLDRLSGVGRTVWMGPEVLAPVLEGFGAGLEFHTARYGLPPGFPQGVYNYLQRLGRGDLEDLYGGLVQRVYPSGTDEQRLVVQNLKDHMLDLVSLLAG